MLNDSTGFFIAYLDLEVWKSSQGLRLWWRVSVSGAQAINKNVYMLTTHSLNIITCIACNQIKVMYSTLSNLIQAHHIDFYHAPDRGSSSWSLCLLIHLNSLCRFFELVHKNVQFRLLAFHLRGDFFNHKSLSCPEKKQIHVH